MKNTRSFLAWHFTGFRTLWSLPFRINVVIIQRFGELDLQVRAADALLAAAAPRSTPAAAGLTDEHRRRGVARRRRRQGVRGGAPPTRCGSALFEVGGTRSASTDSTCTGTGATPAPTPCTTRPAGRSSTSAGTSLNGIRPPRHGLL